MRKRLTICALSLLTLTGMAQTEGSDHMPTYHTEGITYFLPQTAIDITIDVQKVTYTPGDFCQYANRYLRSQGVSSTPETYWEIKDIRITPVGVADPQKMYTIKMKDRSLASLVSLTEENTLSSINYDTPPQPEQAPLPKPAPQIPATNPRRILSEEVLAATSTAKMAELVAREIYNIRDSRNSIIRGQADNMPKDGEALKIILNNLQEQEAALTSLFEGVTTRQDHEVTIRLTPEASSLKGEVLFRFSRKLGIVDADDLGGAPYYYDLENLSAHPTPDEKASKKSKRPQGVIYTIPGKGRLRIYRSQDVIYDGEVHIAQWGETDVLSTDLFGKGATTRILFDTATGAIRHIDN